MKIELKKIKIAEHMSEETTAFTAEIYIDGVNAGYAKNDGRGGMTDYTHHYSENKAKIEANRKLIEQAENYCLSLPPIDYGTFKIDMNLEHFIDNLIEDEIKKKDKNKFEKKMINHIMWGVPGSSSYVQVKLPKPITHYTLPAIQKAIDTYKKGFKKGEQFLNTNLEALGVKL